MARPRSAEMTVLSDACSRLRIIRRFLMSSFWMSIEFRVFCPTFDGKNSLVTNAFGPPNVATSATFATPRNSFSTTFLSFTRFSSAVTLPLMSSTIFLSRIVWLTSSSRFCNASVSRNDRAVALRPLRVFSYVTAFTLVNGPWAPNALFLNVVPYSRASWFISNGERPSPLACWTRALILPFSAGFRVFVKSSSMSCRASLTKFCDAFMVRPVSDFASVTRSSFEIGSLSADTLYASSTSLRPLSIWLSSVRERSSYDFTPVVSIFVRIPGAVFSIYFCVLGCRELAWNTRPAAVEASSAVDCFPSRAWRAPVNAPPTAPPATPPTAAPVRVFPTIPPRSLSSCRPWPAPKIAPDFAPTFAP